MQNSYLLNNHECAESKVKCVTGECRNSIDDCPSQITCPSQLPIQCRDGQCVKSKIFCEDVDSAVVSNLQTCSDMGMLLCTSDLITCTTSLSKCPARSSCPIGFIKCWDESCINVQNGQSCPSVVNAMITQRQSLSTCSD